MADSSLSRSRHAAVLGISFIVGMTVFGLLLGHAVRSFKRLNEFVTVLITGRRNVGGASRPIPGFSLQSRGTKASPTFSSLRANLAD